jgi:hypothetical protein
MLHDVSNMSSLSTTLRSKHTVSNGASCRIDRQLAEGSGQQKVRTGSTRCAAVLPDQILLHGDMRSGTNNHRSQPSSRFNPSFPPDPRPLSKIVTHTQQRPSEARCETETRHWQKTTAEPDIQQVWTTVRTVFCLSRLPFVQSLSREATRPTRDLPNPLVVTTRTTSLSEATNQGSIQATSHLELPTGGL